jgi:hypothetical protein
MFGISNKGTKNGLEGAALDTSDARQRLLRELRLVAADVHGGEAAVCSQRLHDAGRHAACNTQHATCNIRHATDNTPHATCNTQRATCNMRHATQHDTTRHDKTTRSKRQRRPLPFLPRAERTSRMRHACPRSPSARAIAGAPCR